MAVRKNTKSARRPAAPKSKRALGKSQPEARGSGGLSLIDAPWRHKYFALPRDPGCFICRAIDGSPRHDAKNLLLLRGDRAVILLNRYPYTMGGLMIAPVAHFGRLQDLDDTTLLEMMQLVKKGMAILDQAIRPKAYNIGINQGVEAGAGLSEHLHIHLVPRWGADTNFMTTIGKARVLAEDVDGMYQRLGRARQELEKDKANRSKR